MSLAISVENVSKRYNLGTIDRKILWKEFTARWKRKDLAESDEKPDANEFWALKDINFNIRQGEVVGVMGKNGAGKSTLLKILSRITAPTTGRVRINGRVGSLLEVGTGFNPEMTGRENVYLNGAILGMSKRETDAQFVKIVEFANLEKFIDTPVKRYSSGMYMRLAFAIASFLEPDILILDEVLAVGDINFQKKCFDRVEYLMKRGHTILFVSHEPASIVKFCQRVIWLENSRIRYDGPPEEGCEMYRKEQMAATLKVPSAPGREGITHFESDSSQVGTGLWKIRSFVAINSENEEENPKLGKPCDFYIGYECADPSAIEKSTPLAVLAILDEQGRRIMAMRSDHMGLNISGLKPKGFIRFHLPKLPLLLGTYSIFIRFWANGEMSDEITSSAFFEVKDGDFYGSGISPLRSFTAVCIEGESSMQESL